MDALLSLLGLPHYSYTTIAYLIVSAGVAGLARGFSGFGSALIFTPLASVVITPQIAAPLLWVIDAIGPLGLLPQALKKANKREIAIMLCGAFVGVPVGTWILVNTNPIAIRWMIAGAVLPMLCILILGWRYTATLRASIVVGVGAVSGFLSGLAQIGGPPVVLYWLGGQEKSDVVRANLLLFFSCVSIISGISFYIGGLLVSEVFSLAVIAFPVYAVSLWLGSRMFGVASEMTFRRICYLLIAVAVLISLPILDGVIR